MDRQLLLNLVVLIAIVVWIGQLVWLYRQAVDTGDDPLSLVSGAAIFFVLAVPVAMRAPELVARMSDFWQRVTSVGVFASMPTRSTPRLIVGGKSYPLTAERTRLGRFANNDIVLDHPTVSSYHAEIIARPDGRHELIDTNSSNGTRINGTPIRSAVLRDGDQLTLGALTLHFLNQSTAARGLEQSNLAVGRRRIG